MSTELSLLELVSPELLSHAMRFLDETDRLNCPSEADDPQPSIRGRYFYRDNSRFARSEVVCTDDSPKRSSASFDIGDASEVAIIDSALAASGYPLAKVRCTFEEGGLTLSGEVYCYYHAQIAISTVRHIFPDQHLNYQVTVISLQDTSPETLRRSE